MLASRTIAVTADAGRLGIASWRQLARGGSEEHPRIGLVFTDVSLPGKFDGLRLAHELSALRPDVSLVVASGPPPFPAISCPIRPLSWLSLIALEGWSTLWLRSSTGQSASQFQAKLLATAGEVLQILAEILDLSPQLVLLFRSEHHTTLLPG